MQTKSFFVISSEIKLIISYNAAWLCDLKYFQSIWSIKFAYLTAICTLEKFKLFISDYLLIDYLFLVRKLNKEHLASIHRWCVLLWVCVSVYGCVGVNFYKLGLLSQCMYVLNIPAWVCSKKGAEASINTLWSNFCCSMETIIIYSPSSEIVLFF